MSFSSSHPLENKNFLCNGEGRNMLIGLNVTYCYFSAVGQRLLLRGAVGSVVMTPVATISYSFSKVGDLLSCQIKYSEFWSHLQF